MKKLVSGLVVLMLVMGVVSPSFAAENSNRSTKAEEKQLERLAKEQEKMIEAVEPYVKVTEEGTFSLENVPTKLYKKYDLGKLQQHFDNLNKSSLMVLLPLMRI